MTRILVIYVQYHAAYIFVKLSGSMLVLSLCVVEVPLAGRGGQDAGQ